MNRALPERLFTGAKYRSRAF